MIIFLNTKKNSMADSIVSIFPFVRLTKDEENIYILEVMLPIEGDSDDIAVLLNETYTHVPEDGYPAGLNYIVGLETSKDFSASNYVYKKIQLFPNEDSNGIVVIVNEIDTNPIPDPDNHGPKRDGKTIIQFEDADDR
jgi:hypothetical protein